MAISDALRITHTKTNGYTVEGTLINKHGVPLNCLVVKLVQERGAFGSCALAKTTTTESGNYSFKLGPHVAYNDKIFVHVFAKILGEKKKFVESIKVKVDWQLSHQNLGFTISSLYATHSDIPTLIQSEPDKDPQGFSKSNLFSILKTAIPDALKHVALSAAKGHISIENVQKVFGIAYPSVKLDEAILIDMLLNWEGTRQWIPTDNVDEWKRVYDWNRFEEDPVSNADFPITSVTIRRAGTSFKVAQVTIEFEKQGRKTYFPEDKEFIDSLYLVSSACLYYTEAFLHLGWGHLLTGELAIAFYSSIHKHPIKKLLEPVLSGVLAINRAGDGIIFRKTGVLGVGKFTDEGINQVLKISLMNLSYPHRPDQPVGECDHYGHAKNLYWDKVEAPFVRQFFLEYKKEIASDAAMAEMRLLSQNLVANSLPFQPIDCNPLSHEIDNQTKGRAFVDGQYKALRPINTIEDLEEYCIFTRYSSIFIHSAVHRGQKGRADNLEVASLAPAHHAQNIHQKFGGTDPELGAQQLSIGKILVDSDVPTLLKSSKTHPYYKQLLLAQEENFKKLGYNIHEWYPGVII